MIYLEQVQENAVKRSLYCVLKYQLTLWVCIFAYSAMVAQQDCSFCQLHEMICKNKTPKLKRKYVENKEKYVRKLTKAIPAIQNCNEEDVLSYLDYYFFLAAWVFENNNLPHFEWINTTTIDATFSVLTNQETKQLYNLGRYGGYIYLLRSLSDGTLHQYFNQALHTISSDSFRAFFMTKSTRCLQKAFGINIMEATAKSEFYPIKEYLLAIQQPYLKSQIDTLVYKAANKDSLALHTYFEDLHGDSVLFKQLLDKEYLLLDCWASFCKPCIQSFPQLNQLAKKYAHSTHFVSLLWDDIPKAKKLIAKKGGEHLHYLFTQPYTEFVRNMQIYAYPTYFIFNKKGKKLLGPVHRLEEIDVFLNDKISKE